MPLLKTLRLPSLSCLRARQKITWYFSLSSSDRLCPIFNRQILNAAKAAHPVWLNQIEQIRPKSKSTSEKYQVIFCRALSFIFFVIAIFFFTTDCFSAQIKVKWSPNIEKDVAGYKIYYGNSSRNYNNRVDAGNRTSYTISNLTEGNTYFIGITAYDLNGNESGYSDEISYVASTPDNNSHLLPLEGRQNTSQIKRTNGGFVYATKNSRFVHRPNCEKLISSTESGMIKGKTEQKSNPKIDFYNYQITQLEEEITKLREKYFDTHPNIEQRKNKINRLKKQIEEETNKNPGPKILPETENLIKFSSLEKALRDGAIACPVCNP